jgi:hypothetical protein
MKNRNLKNRAHIYFGPFLAIIMWIGAFVTIGCFIGEDWDDLEPINVQHALTNNADCGSFEGYAKQSAIQLMRAQVEAARNQDAQWGNDIAAGGEDMADDTSSDADGDSDGDYSETNVQEQGVDEADLTKTDGEHIFALHQGELVIIDAAEDGQMAETGRADVGGYADELFVYGDLAVVFSTLYEDEAPEELRYYKEDDPYGMGVAIDYACWDEWCYGEHMYSQIAVIDISDKSAPEVVRTIIYAGRYQTSRRIDNALRAVIFSPLPALEMFWDWGDYSDNWWETESGINKFYKELIEKNEDRFNALTLDQIMPKKLDSVDGQAQYITACESVLGPKTPAGIGLTTVISIDLEQPTSPASSLAVFGAEGIAYASANALYLTTSRHYVMEAFESGLWTEESSGIHKFDLTASDSAAYYLATGVVPGRMLNQFCLGEKDDYLRVATTTGSRWDSSMPGLENHVFVLQQQGLELGMVGRLDGLGLGQEIYAARFMGDRGFMVTFVQTDPLYTLDMSDPGNPRAVGEWHGPGYSTYLHPVGASSILSVGMGENWTVNVSLYDISDFAAPTLVTRLNFPDSSFTSEALGDHKAFTFNDETGFLALPFFSWNNYDTGIYTYDVQETSIAKGPTLYLNEESGYNEDTARRSLYIGDNLYGVSRCRITSGLIDDPSPAIATLPLFTVGSCDDFDNYYYGWD